MRIEEKKDDYIRRIAKTTGLSEKECLDALREKFKTYNPKDTSTYSTYLHKKGHEAFEESMKASKKEAIMCPYHPESKTIGNTKWLNIYTKLRESWECAEGGDRCYVRWRTDSLMEFLGKDPIDWTHFDENKDEILKERLENA